MVPILNTVYPKNCAHTHSADRVKIEEIKKILPYTTYILHFF